MAFVVPKKILIISHLITANQINQQSGADIPGLDHGNQRGLPGLHARGHLLVACDPLESADAGHECHLGFWDELVNEFPGVSKVYDTP